MIPHHLQLAYLHAYSFLTYHYLLFWLDRLFDADLAISDGSAVDEFNYFFDILSVLKINKSESSDKPAPNKNLNFK